MNSRWWVFVSTFCLLLLLGSSAGAVVTLDQRAYEKRGWEDATKTLDLPRRLPLAGVNVDLLQYSSEELATELDRIAGAGFTWVRQPFLWETIEPEQGAPVWEAYDEIVAAVAAHDGLQLVAVLDGTPAWARHALAPEHPFAPPASVEEYAHFAGMVAARYADTIAFYQVWDEPNIKMHWGNLDPRPAHYVAMLRGSYKAIHNADPTANVIAAALAPTVETGPDNLSDLLYLRAIYDLGGQDFFDAAAGKPYGYDHSPTDRRVDEDLLNFSRLALLREEMVRRGDAVKPLWGSNFGWNHLRDDWSGPPSIWGNVTAAEQLAFTRDAYRRALREWPWLGGLIVHHWQPDAPPDDPVQGFAVAPVIDQWLEADVVPRSGGLIPGLHPAQNPYATYSENWRFSELGADAVVQDTDTTDSKNRITVQFDGTAFAIPVRRDDYLAYLTVIVDGQPANALPRNRQGETAIILTSPERKPELTLIRVAEGLSEGVHTVEIVHQPELGDDRWPIAGYAVAVPFDQRPYDRALIICAAVGVIAAAGAVLGLTRLPWRNLRPPTVPTMKQGIEWLVSLFTSVLVLFGTLVTWGETIPHLLRRDPPALAITILTAGIASLSPVFLLTLVALGILFVLIYNRPLLGVMLVIFWSAFFLSTLDLLFDMFVTVEVYLGLTLAALLARGLVSWGRQRSAAGQAAMFRFRLTPLDGLALALALLGALSISWATYRSPAMRDLRVVILEPVAFYFLLRLMPLERRDLMWLVDTMLFTGGAIAMVGLLLFFTGESVVEAEDGARRLISIYGSPNGVGLYLGRCLPFAGAYVLLVPRGSWHWLYGLTSGIVMLAAVLFSQSRGAILLGLPAAAVMALVVWRGRQALLPVALAGAGLVAGWLVLSLVLPRLSDLTGSTAIFRQHLWYSSANLIRERPVTGVGLDQFLYWYRSRYLLPEAWAEPNLSIPHNILLNHWVNLGIVGVAIGIGFQAVFWRQIRHLRRTQLRHALSSVEVPVAVLVVGVAGSMADFLAHGLVDVSYFSVNLAFVFFFSLALLQRLTALNSPLSQNKPQ